MVVITSHLDTLGTKISPLLKVPLTKMILTTSPFSRWDISDRYIWSLEATKKTLRIRESFHFHESEA